MTNILQIYYEYLKIWYEYLKNILTLKQDTLDVRLPQGAALIFQQKGMLHAGLGQNFHLLDCFLNFQIFMLHAGVGENFHFLKYFFRYSNILASCWTWSELSLSDYLLNFQIFMLHAELGKNFHFLNYFLNI